MNTPTADFPVEVIRTSRRTKTASIKIVDQRIQVIVPKDFSQDKVDSLLKKKAVWIREKLRIHSQIIPLKPKEYVSGESFAYLGKNYRLKLTESGSETLKFIGNRFVLGIGENHLDDKKDAFVKAQLECWFKKHAEKRLKEKTKRYAKILGVKPNSISVKSYKSRWGSCSTNGDISFNWKIIIAPHHIVDYVVVHELNHMIEHNHSPKFWRGVERVIPDYRECKEWLKENGEGLGV